MHQLAKNMTRSIARIAKLTSDAPRKATVPMVPTPAKYRSKTISH
jgi:hypothetical protein